MNHRMPGHSQSRARQRLAVLALLLGLLAACSSTADQVFDPPPTSTLRPTATPVPLAELDLASLMFVEGDLPDGYMPAKPKPPVNRDPGDLMPLAALMQDYLFKEPKRHQPFVTTILELYRTPEEAREMYEADLGPSLWDFPNDSTIGDVGTIELKQLVTGDPNTNVFRILFVRCHARVHIAVLSSQDHTILLDYAERLDARLMEAVCRPEEPTVP